MPSSLDQLLQLGEVGRASARRRGRGRRSARSAGRTSPGSRTRRGSPRRCRARRPPARRRTSRSSASRSARRSRGVGARTRPRALGVELGELLGDGVAEVGHPQRVVPEVRVVVALVSSWPPRGRAPSTQVDDLGRVEDVALGGLVDRVVDGRLEAALVDDQVGARDLGGLPDGELEVVRLAAGGGEVVDRRCSPATRSATYCSG